VFAKCAPAQEGDAIFREAEFVRAPDMMGAAINVSYLHDRRAKAIVPKGAARRPERSVGAACHPASMARPRPAASAFRLGTSKILIAGARVRDKPSVTQRGSGLMKHLGPAAGAIAGAIAASFLTLHQGLTVGIIGGAIVGALVGIIVALGTRGRS